MRIMSFGKGIRISYNLKGKQVANFKFVPQGTIQEIIKNASFFCDFVNNRKIFINKEEQKFIENEDHEKLLIKVDGLRNFIKYLEYAQKTFEAIGFLDKIVFSDFSSEDKDKIKLLIDSIIFHEAVPLENEIDKSHCFVMIIAEHHIMLLATRISEKKFRLHNFFEKGITVDFSINNSSKLFKAPGVLVLTTENFLSLDNINYDVIFEEIVNFKNPSEIYNEQVNQILLRMLLAFDKNQDDELLTCAIRISDWLKTVNLPGKRNSAINHLNYLQSIRRRRNFNDSETALLHDILGSNKSDFAILTGTYILLEDYRNANESLSRLSEEVQDAFNKYPIANLWQKTSDLHL
jgi:hypothetical protein